MLLICSLKNVANLVATTTLSFAKSLHFLLYNLYSCMH